MYHIMKHQYYPTIAHAQYQVIPHHPKVSVVLLIAFHPYTDLIVVV